MQPVRGAKNFNLHYIYSGNRRKVTSVFQLRLVGTSCANVAGCQMKFQAPLTSHKMVSAFSRTITCILSNIGKTDDNKKRKMCWLELEHSVWKITLFQMQNKSIAFTSPLHFNEIRKRRKGESYEKKTTGVTSCTVPYPWNYRCRLWRQTV